MSDRIWVRFSSAADLREAFVRDISRDRMLLRVEPKWSIGDHLVVGLRLPDDSAIEMEAEVVHVAPRDLTLDRPGGVGVRFTNLDAKTRGKIERFVSDAIAGREQRETALADYEVRPTREIPVMEIARRVQSRLQALEDVIALPELATGDLGLEPEVPGSEEWDDFAAAVAEAVELDGGGPSTKEVPVFDPNLLMGIQDELALVARGRQTGSAYDVLGANPEASIDGLVGLYSSRVSALQDESLGKLPDSFAGRIGQALQDLEAAIQLLSEPERRAALDIRLGVLWPSNRSAVERQALRAQLKAQRDGSTEERRADWPKAEPLLLEAVTHLENNELDDAHRAIRMASLYDPYNVEYLELQARIDGAIDKRSDDSADELEKLERGD